MYGGFAHLGGGCSLDRVRSEAEAASKLKRRKKRKREKISKGQDEAVADRLGAENGIEEETVAATDELASVQVTASHSPWLQPASCQCTSREYTFLQADWNATCILRLEPGASVPQGGVVMVLQ